MRQTLLSSAARTRGRLAAGARHGLGRTTMVIIMKTGATEDEKAAVIARVKESGFRPFINPGVERTVIALLGEVDIDKIELVDVFANMAGVERVQLISDPFKLSSR